MSTNDKRMSDLATAYARRFGAAHLDERADTSASKPQLTESITLDDLSTVANRKGGVWLATRAGDLYWVDGPPKGFLRVGDDIYTDKPQTRINVKDIVAVYADGMGREKLLGEAVEQPAHTRITERSSSEQMERWWQGIRASFQIIQDMEPEKLGELDQQDALMWNSANPQQWVDPDYGNYDWDTVVQELDNIRQWLKLTAEAIVDAANTGSGTKADFLVQDIVQYEIGKLRSGK